MKTLLLCLLLVTAANAAPAKKKSHHLHLLGHVAGAAVHVTGVVLKTVF